MSNFGTLDDYTHSVLQEGIYLVERNNDLNTVPRLLFSTRRGDDTLAYLYGKHTPRLVFTKWVGSVGYNMETIEVPFPCYNITEFGDRISESTLVRRAGLSRKDIDTPFWLAPKAQEIKESITSKTSNPSYFFRTSVSPDFNVNINLALEHHRTEERDVTLFVTVTDNRKANKPESLTSLADKDCRSEVTKLNFVYSDDLMSAKQFENLIWQPDGDRMAFDIHSTLMYIINTRNMRLTPIILTDKLEDREGNFLYETCCFSKDGKLFAVASILRAGFEQSTFNEEAGEWQNTIVPSAYCIDIFDTETGQRKHRFDGVPDNIIKLAFGLNNTLYVMDRFKGIYFVDEKLKWHLRTTSLNDVIPAGYRYIYIFLGMNVFEKSETVEFLYALRHPVTPARDLKYTINHCTISGRSDDIKLHSKFDVLPYYMSVAEPVHIDFANKLILLTKSDQNASSISVWRFGPWNQKTHSSLAMSNMTLWVDIYIANTFVQAERRLNFDVLDLVVEKIGNDYLKN